MTALFEIKSVLQPNQVWPFENATINIDGVRFEPSLGDSNTTMLRLVNNSTRVVRTQLGHMLPPSKSIKFELVSGKCCVTLDQYKNPFVVYRTSVPVPENGGRVKIAKDSGVFTQSQRRPVDTGGGNSAGGVPSRLPQGEPDSETSWEMHNKEGILEFRKGVDYEKTKYAIFDMDHTVIKPLNGRRFPKDHTDWEWAFNRPYEKLNEYHRQGYQVVLLSNQGGMHSKKANQAELIKNFKTKIGNVTHRLQSCWAFFSTEKTIMRKPAPGLVPWKLANMDKEHTFYCGDAAGRPAGKGKKKPDFAASDLQWALNVGIKFYIPEQIFDKGTYTAPETFEFDPRKLKTQDLTTFQPECSVVMMVGLPGCGKSTLSRSLKDMGYTIINQDTLKTKEKCLAEFRRLVKNPKCSIVVDNTNAQLKSRESYLAVAKGYSVKVEAVLFDMDFKRIQHNAMFRHYSDPVKNPLISTIVMNTVKKNFTPPSDSEGFAKITKLKDPLFERPDGEMYYQFLV